MNYRTKRIIAREGLIILLLLLVGGGSLLLHQWIEKKRDIYFRTSQIFVMGGDGIFLPKIAVSFPDGTSSEVIAQVWLRDFFEYREAPFGKGNVFDKVYASISHDYDDKGNRIFDNFLYKINWRYVYIFFFFIAYPLYWIGIFAVWAVGVLRGRAYRAVKACSAPSVEEATKAMDESEIERPAKTEDSVQNSQTGEPDRMLRRKDKKLAGEVAVGNVNISWRPLAWTFMLLGGALGPLFFRSCSKPEGASPGEVMGASILAGGATFILAFLAYKLGVMMGKRVNEVPGSRRRKIVYSWLIGVASIAVYMAIHILISSIPSLYLAN